MKGRGNDGDSSGAASYVKPGGVSNRERSARYAWNIKDLFYSDGWCMQNRYFFLVFYF